MARILVMGSYNVGLTVRTPQLPRPGETLLGDLFLMGPGGKGSNQALAARRLGGDVLFLAKVGDDVFGRDALELFEREGLDTRLVLVDSTTHTGAGIIALDEGGQNAISVAPGANHLLKPEDVDRCAGDLAGSRVLLMQLETPIETVARATEVAKRRGVTVILNPAPAQEVPRRLLAQLDVLTPNEHEAATLTGRPVNDLSTAFAAARQLHNQGVAHAVVTLGAEGCVHVCESGEQHLPAPVVTPVDTTGAGDAFNGGLAVALARGDSIGEALQFANVVGALSVTTFGTVEGLPTLEQVEAFGRGERLR